MTSENHELTDVHIYYFTPKSSVQITVYHKKAPGFNTIKSIGESEEKLIGPKGDLISESFTFLFHSLKIVPNHYPELYQHK